MNKILKLQQAHQPVCKPHQNGVHELVAVARAAQLTLWLDLSTDQNWNATGIFFFGMANLRWPQWDLFT